ncbi:MAG: AAA family ATPase [Propionibacteriaceae bacterium]|nr:AAA family ATPase [Propionibacteriaceae bacterium]
MPNPAESAFERERAIEQTNVDAVYAQLEHAAAAAREIAAESAARYTSDRESWLREEHGTALFERDAFAFQAARRLATLDAEHEGLVFGRLDFQDHETRYVGRIGVRSDDYEPMVIDWRARAAEPFYRATASQPMSVVRRRVLQCRHDLVVGIEDDLIDAAAAWPELTVLGEGALMAALSRARGPKMRDIVTTIQAEQDEAIRAPWQGFTVIAGGPGTGKTVVGLHRAAYLLYSHRSRFENGGVLVVGPSSVFMAYIERVLPSLGEDSVTLRSLGQVASDVLGYAAGRLDSAEAAVLKGSPRMVRLLRRLVESPVRPLAPTGLRLTVKGEILSIDPDRLAGLRRQALGSRTYHQARAVVERQLIDHLWRSSPADLAVADADQFADLVQGTPAFDDLMDDWWPALTPAETLRRLSDRAVVDQVGRGQLTEREAAVLAGSYADDDFSVADIALLDELAALLGAPPKAPEPDLFLDGLADLGEVVTTADRLDSSRELEDDGSVHSTYAHILVDEAQDVTPMQWRMLRRRGPQSSWTIVGDPAQSSWPDPAETARTLADLAGSAPQRHFRLSTNYRSPAEVFDLAAQVITLAYPEADLPQAVRRTGIEPRLLVAQTADMVESVLATVDALLEEVAGTVGLIAPERWRDALAQAAGRRDPQRLALADPILVKGLEYDAVVVVDPDAIVAESSGGPRTLYVCLTRPTRILVTVDPDRPGAWRPADPDLSAT